MSVSAVLGKIRGPHVEIAGWLIILVAHAFLWRSASGIAIAALLAFYVVTRKRPQLFDWLKDFAEPSTWPAYVTIGVIIVIAACHGGAVGGVIAGGALAMNDGRTFDELY